jgi:hypothetical protein
MRSILYNGCVEIVLACDLIGSDEYLQSIRSVPGPMAVDSHHTSNKDGAALPSIKGM